MELSMIRDRIESRPEFDVIVCSCGHLSCQHTFAGFIADGIRLQKTEPDRSSLHKAYNDMLEVFKKYDVIGDLAWNPMTITGPVPLEELPLRVATMLTLEDLQRIKRESINTRLIMAAGPCSQPNCQIPKDKLIKWALQERLPHSLYVDRRSAIAYLALLQNETTNQPTPSIPVKDSNRTIPTNSE